MVLLFVCCVHFLSFGLSAPRQSTSAVLYARACPGNLSNFMKSSKSSVSSRSGSQQTVRRLRHNWQYGGSEKRKHHAIELVSPTTAVPPGVTSIVVAGLAGNNPRLPTLDTLEGSMDIRRLAMVSFAIRLLRADERDISTRGISECENRRPCRG